jgi:hypothetical protein
MIVLLQTCDRSQYTRRTVDAFLRWNDPAGFQLEVADDASGDTAGLQYAIAHGFRPVLINQERAGVTVTLGRAVRRLFSERGDDLLLYLQNDCEFVRTLPLAAIQAAMPAHDCVRLFGRFKGYGDPTKDRNDGRARHWRTLPAAEEMMSTGLARWSDLPSVARLSLILRLTKGARSEKEMRRNGGRQLRVACLERNVIYHFGEQRTPSGLYR